jgi:hypothetical protein
MERMTSKILSDTLYQLNCYTQKHYSFYIAYGKYTLIDHVTHRSITGMLSMREMYYVLLGIMHTIENENR